MKTMLSRLLAKKDTEIQTLISDVDASAAPRGLRRRFEKIRSKKQGGFTLLELLVVVAILATIAATATILLEDTDRKASAAAHVTIMDELTKGVATYRVLHQGQMPDNWDSLLSSTDGTLTSGNVSVPTASAANFGLDGDLAGMLGATVITADIATALNGVGINNVQVLNLAATNDPNGGSPGSCSSLANMRTMIADTASNVTNSSIFMTNAAAQGRGGCAASAAVAVGAGNSIARLNAAENYRVGAGANDILIALGFGGSLDLFNKANLGAMSGAPFYRHVDGTTYNRFVALFNVGGTGGVGQPVALTEARFQGVIDGSGDTKEEELAEWDNTRSTL